MGGGGGEVDGGERRRRGRDGDVEGSEGERLRPECP